MLQTSAGARVNFVTRNSGGLWMAVSRAGRRTVLPRPTRHAKLLKWPNSKDRGVRRITRIRQIGVFLGVLALWTLGDAQTLLNAMLFPRPQRCSPP